MSLLWSMPCESLTAPPFKLNSDLMASAQAHSEYQAANQDTMRTGVDGSTAKDRAISAGFGGGATVFVSENIASGVNISPDRAVQVWQGDSLHLKHAASPELHRCRSWSGE